MDLINPINQKGLQIDQMIATVIENDTEFDLMMAANQTDASKDTLARESEENTTMGLRLKSKDLKKPENAPRVSKVERTEKALFVRKDEADSLADEFIGRDGNREYNLKAAGLSRLAQALGEEISTEADADQIIRLIRDTLSENGNPPDVAQIDKAFEFLLEVMEGKLIGTEGETVKSLKALHAHIKNVKNQFYELHSPDIQLAQKIIGAADAMVKEPGLDTNMKETLTHLRGLILEPQDVQAKRKYYEVKGYKWMVMEFKALFRYLGANLQRKYLENAEIHRLLDETKTLQAVLGVYRQAKREWPILFKWLISKGIIDPIASEFRARINFESIAKLFFDSAEERYPNADRLLQFNGRLSDPLSQDPLARAYYKIAILSALRNMVKEVAPLRLYRSFQHRDDLYLAILEASEGVETELDQLEEEWIQEEEQEPIRHHPGDE